MAESQIGRRFWSMQIKRLILAFAVAFGLGIAFDYFANAEYSRSGLWAGVAGIAVYLIASLGVSLVGLLSGLAYNLFWRGKDMQDAFLIDLRAAKMPGPDDWHAKTYDYLEAIAGDDEYPADIRVKAASLYAMYLVAYQKAGFFNGVALAQAANDAALRYAQEAPRYDHPSEKRRS